MSTETAPPKAEVKTANQDEMLKAVTEYKKRGWVVHPLSCPNDKGKSPGKRPLIKEWQKLEKTPDNIDEYIIDGCNIGLVCGKASNVTVLDFDHMIFMDDVFAGIDGTMLSSSRTKGRGHVYFKYRPDLTAQKMHELGIEILTNGNNAVLPPSVHKSGDTYKWLNPDTPILDMSDTVKDNLLTLFQTYIDLQTYLSQCRACFKKVIEQKPNMHGADGRMYMLAVCTDLKAHGATEQHIKMFARLMYGKEYDAKRTLEEWNNIDPAKTWRCETLKEKLPTYVNIEQCEKCAKKSKEKRGEKEQQIRFVSEIDFPDGRHAEEIIKDGIPVFIVYNPATKEVAYSEELEHNGIKKRPIPIDGKLREALTLPDGVEEYGTLEQLIKDMIEFAEDEYDPVSNKELYHLVIHLFLSSWIMPRWMQSYPEKFFPIVSARGPSETGKKRFLTVGRWLSYRGMYALKTVRVPTLFRMIEPWNGTLILDEADLNDSNESSDFIEFINARADGVSIPRYSGETGNVEWWNSFGMTLTATRKAYMDDGAESRTVMFPAQSTYSPGDYDLIPPKEWMEKGKVLQRKLLLFRLRHLTGDVPNNLQIDGVRGFRVREALLPLQALSSEYPDIIKNIADIAKTMEKRIIAERANSREGVVLNVVYNAILDGVIVEDCTDKYIKITWTKDGQEFKAPLTANRVAYTLNKTFQSREIASIWRGLGQQVKGQMKLDNKKHTSILLITDKNRLNREFHKYVPDAKDVCETEPRPDKPSGMVPDVPEVPDIHVCPPSSKNINNINISPPPSQPTNNNGAENPPAHTCSASTSSTSSTEPHGISELMDMVKVLAQEYGHINSNNKVEFVKYCWAHLPPEGHSPEQIDGVVNYVLTSRQHKLSMADLAKATMQYLGTYSQKPDDIDFCRKVTISKMMEWDDTHEDGIYYQIVAEAFKKLGWV